MKRIIFYMLFVLLAAAFLYPVIATICLSFQNGKSVSFIKYFDLLFDCFTFYEAFWNSVLYAVVTTIIELLIIIPCAFGLTQVRFKGKGILFMFYIVLMMMPLQVTILPNYIGLRDMGLLDTRFSIILPAIFSPFGVVVIHQYMQSMNDSIIEALRLETNSMIKILFYSVIPQVKTCILAVAVFIFAESWNMLEQPMFFLKNEKLQNLSVFINKAENFSGDILFPASVLFFIPILLLYLFFNDYLEKGISFEGLEK